MNTLIAGWVHAREDPLTLFEDNHAITLQRESGALKLSVQLTLSRPGNAQLETWMRPGEYSLGRFQGALSQAPDRGALWLVQCLQDEANEEQILGCLESLLNQRDAWRAMVARQARPLPPTPSSALRSLAL
ncbi:type III secretion protein [Pseudomonas sp. AMR01]|uniref:type III secretion protein n=1 Tax=Pseudomonas sp. AMR01 TaxID=3064904 RepID=UPI0035C07BFF